MTLNNIPTNQILLFFVNPIKERQKKMEFATVLFYILLCLIVIFLAAQYFADADLTLLFYHTVFGAKDYKEQVIWITGASSGIGEYLAYSLVKRNAKLALSGTNIQRLENVKKHCIEISNCDERNILLVPFPIQNFNDHESQVKKVLDYFGRIDVLVNNAGISQRADFQDIDIAVDLDLFNINVFGPVNLTSFVLKHFLERKQGHFVVTSSIAGIMGAPYSRTYTGSKHALHGYFECLRTETLHSNIHVTILCPGPVHSQLVNRCVTGKLGETYQFTGEASDSKMTTERCSELMLSAMSHKLDECWITPQPVLIASYFIQYTPSFFRNTLLKIFFSRERIMKFRQGRSNR